DGEEHARAEHENLERNEDYRYPIHYFENFQVITQHHLSCGALRQNAAAAHFFDPSSNPIPIVSVTAVARGRPTR
ncbi:MAG TPA: hypothetical protein VNM48_02185, partial [Chloroflexota bacterium]|nr:hypothetical protein [Chloroflexota bacterium]